MKCILCKSDKDDSIKLGEFKVKGPITVHYYCLLLSSSVKQNGKNNNGILGFLMKDIIKGSRSVASKTCYYCKKKSANIECGIKGCSRTFHTYCGIKNNCLMNFESYKTSCHRHSRTKYKVTHENDEKCVICMEEMGEYSQLKSIEAPCCKNGWFHNSCLAQIALSSGYFFKCPLCNNYEEFRMKVKRKGIFIPDQDAAWEMEPNAFQELRERPNTCSALVCICPMGRQYNKNRYTFKNCQFCGGTCIHRICMKEHLEIFTCESCEISGDNKASTSEQNIELSTLRTTTRMRGICPEPNEAPRWRSSTNFASKNVSSTIVSSTNDSLTNFASINVPSTNVSFMDKIEPINGDTNKENLQNNQ